MHWRLQKPIDNDNARIKKISEDFNKLKDRFLKPKIKEIRRKLYEIEKKKDLSKSKIKEIEQNLIELEESLLEETHTVHTKSLNIDIMMGNETDKIIKKLLESLLQNCPKDLEESVRKSEFFRDSIDLSYYHLQKISLKRGGSYVVSPEWLKNQKATINPKNNDDNCFQYALTFALHYQNIKQDPQRILKIKPFVNQYNWK